MPVAAAAAAVLLEVELELERLLIVLILEQVIKIANIIIWWWSSAYHSGKPIYFNTVCASSAYARGATGDGIQVAVVDTGVHDGHTDLDDNMVSFTSGSDTVNSDNDASDDEVVMVHMLQEL